VDKAHTLDLKKRARCRKTFRSLGHTHKHMAASQVISMREGLAQTYALRLVIKCLVLVLIRHQGVTNVKIALSSYSGMGAWFVLRLMAEGHKVDYYLSKPEYEGVLRGLIPEPKALELDHRRHIVGYGFPSYKGYDLSLFDLTGRPKQADSSRMQCPTLGDGEFEHVLEDDRETGIQAMEHCGINVPPYEKFNTPQEAKPYIKKTDKRYVFKPFTIGGGTQDTATTYVAKDAEDMLKVIDPLWAMAKGAPFILQEFIKGTEIGTEAFFNGSEFYGLTGTLEEKKFMNDNKGPNTGCAGNLIFTMRTGARIFQEGLLKTRPMLQAAGFRGILDLNTIVTDDKIYGLEWTPRFGYLCCPTIAHMTGPGYADLLWAIAAGKTPPDHWKWNFGAGCTMTIPPYPTEIRLPKAKGIPIEGIDPRNIEQLQNYYLFDACVTKDKKSLETSGNYGYVGAAIAGGDTIEQAFSKCYHRVDDVQIPNMQYRTDLEKTGRKRYDYLLNNSWL
jgi:phosphoribosylamine-glycine ligase